MADPIIESLENIATFRVDACCEGYPDVQFEIILKAPPTEAQIEKAVGVLHDFADKYNKWHFLRPIHYVSDIDSATDGDHPWGIYVHIDFGNSSPRALLQAVRALARSDLPIFRVALI